MSDKEIKQQPAAPSEDIGEDINVTTILTVGVVTALVITVVVIALTGLFNKAQSEYNTRINADLADTDIASDKQRQLGSLGSYGWVDRAAGVVNIPIDRAVELTVAELRRDQLNPPEYPDLEPVVAAQDPAEPEDTAQEEPPEEVAAE